MKQRSAFGKTLAEFNGLQGMIAGHGHRGGGGAAAHPARAALKDAGRPAKVAASMAKVFASEVAMKAATRALQIHGGAGYITEFPSSASSATPSSPRSARAPRKFSAWSSPARS
jgi:alkylation response protein AidB-like acyl-CoA dehydrogenase